MNSKEIDTSNPWVNSDDAPELTDEFFRNATPMIGGKVVSREEFDQTFKKALRGRPVGSNKAKTTLRLDKDILAMFKSTGKGWQSRINDALHEWIREHKPA